MESLQAWLDELKAIRERHENGLRTLMNAPTPEDVYQSRRRALHDSATHELSRGNDASDSADPTAVDRVMKMGEQRAELDREYGANTTRRNEEYKRNLVRDIKELLQRHVAEVSTLAPGSSEAPAGQHQHRPQNHSATSAHNSQAMAPLQTRTVETLQPGPSSRLDAPWHRRSTVQTPRVASASQLVDHQTRDNSSTSRVEAHRRRRSSISSRGVDSSIQPANLQTVSSLVAGNPDAQNSQRRMFLHPAPAVAELLWPGSSSRLRASQPQEATTNPRHNGPSPSQAVPRSLDMAAVPRPAAHISHREESGFVTPVSGPRARLSLRSDASLQPPVAVASQAAESRPVRSSPQSADSQTPATVVSSNPESQNAQSNSASPASIRPRRASTMNKRPYDRVPGCPSEPRTANTITFEELYEDGKAETKYNIVDCEHTLTSDPSTSGRFWILRCEQHDLHYAYCEARNARTGPTRHLNLHQDLSQSCQQNRTIDVFGVLVLGCTEELARENNMNVARAIENGYRPVTRVEWASATPQKRRKTTAGGSAAQQVASHPAQGPVVDPNPWTVYMASWRDKMYAVVVLPIQDVGVGDRDGIYLRLQESGLLTRHQPCFTYDSESNKISGWAEDFQYGGSKMRQRQFPCLYFDQEDNIERCDYAWVHVSKLRTLNMTKIDLKHHRLIYKYIQSSLTFDDRSDPMEAHQTASAARADNWHTWDIEALDELRDDQEAPVSGFVPSSTSMSGQQHTPVSSS